MTVWSSTYMYVTISVNSDISLRGAEKRGRNSCLGKEMTVMMTSKKEDANGISGAGKRRNSSSFCSKSALNKIVWKYLLIGPFMFWDWYHKCRNVPGLKIKGAVMKKIMIVTIMIVTDMSWNSHSVILWNNTITVLLIFEMHRLTTAL